MRRLALALALFALAGCDPGEGAAYAWDLPPSFPLPRVPEDNPMSEAKVELGHFLFYDTRVSGNGTQSCASCHAQSLAFTDGEGVSTGSTGELTPRGAMSLTNVAYNSRQIWANPTVLTLEDQAHGPMFNTAPVELGTPDDLAARLAEDPDYPAMFEDAFPNEPDPINAENVIRAIASFERTMISHDAPFDRYNRGDDSAMSESALRGLELFFTERLECFHCHGGFNFSDGVTTSGTVIEEVGFHNTALYNIDGRGGYPAPNRGILEVTGDRRDMGRFRAPTLRNIELTAPYMHDGSIATLDGVLDHYAAGGRTITDGPYAGVGSESPLKNLFMHGFVLSDEERADVMALFSSLTDETFLHDPRFADPFAPTP